MHKHHPQVTAAVARARPRRWRSWRRSRVKPSARSTPRASRQTLDVVNGVFKLKSQVRGHRHVCAGLRREVTLDALAAGEGVR